MKLRTLAFVISAIAFVPLSMLALVVGESFRAPVAEASGIGGGGGTCGAGTGSLVCATSPTLTTPNIGVATGTRLTLTQGVSAVTGVFSGAISSVAPTFTGAATFDRGIFTATTGNAVSITAIGTGEGLYSLSANNASSKACQCDGSGSGGGIYASSTSALAAVEAVNGGASGNAIVITGDTTSPAIAPIMLTPVNANPSGAGADGNLVLVTGAHLRARTASATYNDVGGFLTTTGSLTAFAGGGQASATLVCSSAGVFVVTTVATAADSVKLPPTPVDGQICVIINADGTDAMNLFPGTGDVLCVAGFGCLAADTATSITATQRLRTCYAESASRWSCH